MGFPSQELFKAVFQSFGGSCGKRNGAKSQKDAAAGVQGTAAAGHRNQIPIGAEAAAGGTENAAQNRRQREAEKQRLFDLKQQKRKEKHKGR